MVSISKSRYTSFVTCPKQFWLKCHQPKLAKELDKSLEYRFEQGDEAGETAHGLFSGIVNATALKPDGSLDIGAMCEKTKRLMAANCPAIAEASFSGKAFIARSIFSKTTATEHGIFMKSSRLLIPKNQRISKIYTITTLLFSGTF